MPPTGRHRCKCWGFHGDDAHFWYEAWKATHAECDLIAVAVMNMKYRRGAK